MTKEDMNKADAILRGLYKNRRPCELWTMNLWFWKNNDNMHNEQEGH